MFIVSAIYFFICSLRNLNGSFAQTDTSLPEDGSPSPKKLHEHAQNVRRAVEQRHLSRSMDESQSTSPRGNKVNGTSGFTDDTTFYMME